MQPVQWYRSLSRIAQRRVLAYVATTLVLGFGFLSLRDVQWQGGTQLHTLMEVTATVLALTVGALSLVRFYSANQPLYLYVGSAFLGTGMLDGYHAVVTSVFFQNIFPSPPPSLIPWSWIASRVFLSALLLYSIIDWYRRNSGAKMTAIHESRVYLSTALLTLGSFLFFAFIPLPRAYYPELVFHRPEELVPALLFLLALIGYLRKGYWTEDRFEHWLVLSLLVSFLGQALFMSLSGSLFDTLFDAAHTLKKLSYILVMIGLMISTYHLFRRAEEGVHELAKSNAALRDSETRVRAVLNTVGEGIVMINDKGGIESYNPAAQSIFGYRMDEVLGRSINVLMPSADRSTHDLYIKRYLSTGNKTILGDTREVMGCRKDGTVFPMELSVNELWLGGERKFVGVMRDITQSIQARHDLVEATRTRQAILDSANLSIIATDPDGLILSFNRAAERMLGYNMEEMIAKQTPKIIHDPAEVVERARQLTEELGRAIEPGFEVFVAKARLGLADENVWTYIRKDGSRFPVKLSVTAIRDEDELITGFLGVAADITEQQKVDQMKNEFISVVSHELRTPLTSIRGALGLLSGGVAGVLPAKVKNLIDIAASNSERLVRLINDILDIEKMAAGKMEFRWEVIEIESVIRRAILDNKGFADQQGVQVDYVEACYAKVRCDEERLLQVLVNLLSNAVKFSDQGSRVQVRTNLIKDRVRVSINDQGEGIPADFQDRIFQKFAQADGSDTRSSGGTGLGLSICKSLIEHMGGIIGFDTEIGTGTTFYFELPLFQGASVKLEPLPIAQTDMSPRILVCEDDADVAHLLKLMLEGAGYRVDIAADAMTAHAMLNSHSYAAMTLDIMLPGKDGLTLIRELRAETRTRDLPIVVVSAVAGQGKQELEGGAVGIADWLDKPIDQQRLVDAVDTIIQKRNNEPHILHVEDDVDVREVVAEILDGLAVIKGVSTLAEARAELMARVYDLIILDLGLPDGDGLGLLGQLKTQGVATPVVVFSVRDVDADVAESMAAVMVKSTTSNQTLLETIRHYLQDTHGKAGQNN